MINKFYKSIHITYSTLIKFLFFLRYLFGIFLISTALFLLIPYFFDLKKKEQVIKNYLLESYGFELNKYENIRYSFFPTPRLKIHKANLGIESNLLQINVSNLIIYPKLLNIYNYENYKINKIILNDNEISLEDTELKFLIKYVKNLKNKITFKNLNLKITRKNIYLIDFKKIHFSNYGYNNNVIKGFLFNKKFKIILKDNFKKINFKLLKTGIVADIIIHKIEKDKKLNGIFKLKLLNTNLKFKFDFDNKKIKIFNSYLRNKNLSLRNESIITYLPFFYIDSFSKVEDFNIKILRSINLNYILSSKDFIKKLNVKKEINFKPKKFSKILINDFSIDANLAYGKLMYSNKISILDNFFICKGDINLLEENPILYFDCSFDLNNKKKFFKKFSIKQKNENEKLKLNARGNINILNNKIQFKNIVKDQDYEASDEDLKYYKKTFESVLFDKDFIGIFNIKKIKRFILEIL